MNEEISGTEFEAALRAVIKDLKAPKSQTNSFGHYSYRNAEDIIEAVKPLLDLNNLRLSISDEIVLIGDRYYVKASVYVDGYGHYISQDAYAREPLTKKGMDESQITGATSSYARKYALNGMFCIDDTKDADSMDNTSPKKTLSLEKTYNSGVQWNPGKNAQFDEIRQLSALLSIPKEGVEKRLKTIAGSEEAKKAIENLKQMVIAQDEKDQSENNS